jgi:hypothetical protein
MIKVDTTHMVDIDALAEATWRSARQDGADN